MLLRLVTMRKDQVTMTGFKEERSYFSDWTQGGGIMLLGLISRRKDHATWTSLKE